MANETALMTMKLKKPNTINRAEPRCRAGARRKRIWERRFRMLSPIAKRVTI
jgi:hypothetical protein